MKPAFAAALFGVAVAVTVGCTASTHENREAPAMKSTIIATAKLEDGTLSHSRIKLGDGTTYDELAVVGPRRVGRWNDDIKILQSNMTADEATRWFNTITAPAS